ncbi:hypothetical protein PCANB_001325 [Pneumocystis canis]|nr:hypothetical protein PCANB_001325 [Pneumocystis canis]
MTTLNSFSVLNPSITTPFNAIEVELEEQDTDNFGFLSLQRNAYIQLEEIFVDKTPRYNASLLCIGNKNGYYASGIPSGFVFGTTVSLRESLKGRAVKRIVEHNPLSIIHIQEKIVNVSFSADEQYLIVTTEESKIMFYNTQILLQRNNYLQPEFVFQIEDVKDVLPNPVDSNVTAVLTFFGNLYIINSSQRSISEPLVNNVTSISWSQKGKQIVCGTSDGKLAQYTPDGLLKAVIDKSRSLSDAYYVSSILWLENHVFFVVYSNHNSSKDLTHDYLIFIVTRERNGTITYGKLVDPAPPFGLTNFIVIAATASADIGIIVRNKDDLIWRTLTISDETRRASLPYSALNDCDTSPIGIALDFTLSENIQKPLFPNNEPKEGPPLPILYLLNNDYLLTGYYILYVDAIKTCKAYNFIHPVKENIPNRSFDQNVFMIEKKTGFGFTPMSIPSLPALNSRTTFEKTSNSNTFGSFANTSALPGISFGVPSFGTPSFGNISFGSPVNIGFGNIPSKNNLVNNLSQTVKPSSFTSFASMSKSSNESPFGSLIQNSSQKFENKSEVNFNESKPLFSFFGTSDLQNKEVHIKDNNSQAKNDVVLKDRVDFVSNEESEIMSDNPFGGVMNFFNINESDNFKNNRNQQSGSSTPFSFGASDSFASFKQKSSLSTDYMTRKGTGFSLLTENGQKSFDFFSLTEKNQIKNEIKPLDTNILPFNDLKTFQLSETNDNTDVGKETSIDVFPKHEESTSSFKNLFFDDKIDKSAKKSEELNKDNQNSSEHVDLSVVLSNVSHNEIFDKNVEKIEFNQGNEIKKDSPLLSHSPIYVTPFLKENSLKDNSNPSLNEPVLYDISDNLKCQKISKSHENLHENIFKIDSDNLSSSILLNENKNIDFENHSHLNKNPQDEPGQIEDAHLKSQDSCVLYGVSSISLSDNLNTMESKNNKILPIDFPQNELVLKNISCKAHDHMIEGSPLGKDQHIIKLKPLLSLSEALKAQSEEKGLVKEIDIICLQMDNELNLVKNLRRLDQFIENQKNDDNVQNDSINIFKRQVEEWRLSEILQVQKKISDLLYIISNFQKIENINLDAIKCLKKMFIKLEAKHIEVSRFIRARTDQEFTRMIKVRQLGSEYLENQAKLRKICQNVENCLWKAEEKIALYKVKLAGKTNSNIKLPSLESIKKALGKINSLIQQSTNEVNNLEFEFKKLKMETFVKTRNSIKAKIYPKNMFFSENMLSIITTDILRKDKFLTILKETIKEKHPLHTIIFSALIARFSIKQY